MGFFDSWSDIVAAATPWSMVEAEAPKEEEEEKVCAIFYSILNTTD
jgi:cell division protein YceG involved in septum cleavage